MVFSWLYAYIAWFYHRMFKWILRRVTGKRELQRLCAQGCHGSKRTRQIESALRSSKLSALRRVVEEGAINVGEAVQGILVVKGIDADCNPEFTHRLKGCLVQICGYRSLASDLESLRKQPYMKTRPDHEELLMKLWNLLMPDTPLERRLTRQWGDIGFQGEDPATDFRGMGMLGLLNLMYSYAVVGINMTSTAYHLYQDGLLKNHVYNCVHASPTIEDFHRVYCHILFNFDKYWLAQKPRDIMEFSRIRDQFEEKLRTDLQDPNVELTCKFDLATSD